MTRWLLPLLATACVAMISQSQHYANAQNPNTTCQPAPPSLSGQPSGGGFNVCLFDSTGNLVSDVLATVGNTLFSIQNSAAYFLGSCYCRQDCTPSQIVCNNPGFLNSTLQTLFPDWNVNVGNGIAQFIYLSEVWTFYCYCPSLAGDNPCKAPPQYSLCAP